MHSLRALSTEILLICPGSLVVSSRLGLSSALPVNSGGYSVVPDWITSLQDELSLFLFQNRSRDPSSVKKLPRGQKKKELVTVQLKGS